mgnify:CR=1 FL=1
MTEETVTEAEEETETEAETEAVTESRRRLKQKQKRKTRDAAYRNHRIGRHPLKNIPEGGTNMITETRNYVTEKTKELMAAFPAAKRRRKPLSLAGRCGNRPGKRGDRKICGGA